MPEGPEVKKTVDNLRRSVEKGVYTRRFAVYNQETDFLGNEVIREVTKDIRRNNGKRKAY